MVDTLADCEYFYHDSGCVSQVASSIKPVVDVENCGNDLDTSKFWIHEVHNETEGLIYCKLWEKKFTQVSNLVLPVLIFAALCTLMFIMLFKSIRERAAFRERCLANYNQLKISAEAGDAKPSRVPHSQFQCGGLTMTFQMSSNLNPNKKSAETNEDENNPGSKV